MNILSDVLPSQDFGPSVAVFYGIQGLLRH